MTTSLDTRLVPRVYTLINRFGRDVVYVKAGLKSANPDTDTVVEASPKKYPLKATPPDSEMLKQMGDITVVEGDSGAGIAAQGLTFTPAVNDHVIISDVHWNVVAVQPVYTGDLVALYLLQLRR